MSDKVFLVTIFGAIVGLVIAATISTMSSKRDDYSLGYAECMGKMPSRYAASEK